MPFTEKMTEELKLILKFPDTSLMQGLKIHHDAEPQVIAAAQDLFDRGIITQPDGGYLTDLGHDLAQRAKVLERALR